MIESESDQIKKYRELANCFEFMPGSDGQHFQNEIPKLFLKHEISHSVTFFGGSFNPFHQGHRACLDLCPEENILIVPDRNPFKPINDNKTLFDEFQKLASDLLDTRYSLYPGFLLKTETNPTSSWLPKVSLAEKNFLMGDDSFMSLLSWKNPEVLIKALTKLYIVPRKFSREDYLLQERKIKIFNPHLEFHYLADHPYKNLSSSDLRNSKH
jgi:nicotinate-nucleotide adenylyltransferase